MVELVIWNSLASAAAPGANIVAARLLYVYQSVRDLLRQRSAGTALRSEQESAGEDDLGHAFPCWPVPRILGVVWPIPVDDIVRCLLFNCRLVRLARLLVMVAVFRYGRLLMGGFQVGGHDTVCCRGWCYSGILAREVFVHWCQALLAIYNRFEGRVGGQTPPG